MTTDVTLQATVDPITFGPLPKSAEIDSANRRRGVLRDAIITGLVSTKWTTTLAQAQAAAIVNTANMLALTAVPFVA
jgi:hypothetical protein